MHPAHTHSRVISHYALTFWWNNRYTYTTSLLQLDSYSIGHVCQLTSSYAFNTFKHQQLQQCGSKNWQASPISCSWDIHVTQGWNRGFCIGFQHSSSRLQTAGSNLLIRHRGGNKIQMYTTVELVSGRLLEMVMDEATNRCIHCSLISPRKELELSRAHILCMHALAL